MRIKLTFLSTLIFLMAASLCFGQIQPPSITFVDTGRKPEKMIPKMADNFEIIQGKLIESPIDMEKFAKSAILGIAGFDASVRTATVHSEGTGFVHFRIRPAPAWVDIRLCYWNDEYWFEHVESYRFNAEPEKNKIHRNYSIFINDLERLIARHYNR